MRSLRRPSQGGQGIVRALHVHNSTSASPERFLTVPEPSKAMEKRRTRLRAELTLAEIPARGPDDAVDQLLGESILTRAAWKRGEGARGHGRWTAVEMWRVEERVAASRGAPIGARGMEPDEEEEEAMATRCASWAKGRHGVAAVAMDGRCSS